MENEGDDAWLHQLIRDGGDPHRTAVFDRLEALPRDDYRAVLERLGEVTDRTLDELERGSGVPETPNVPDHLWRECLRSVDDPAPLIDVEPQQRIWLLWELLDLATGAQRSDWVDPSTLFDLVRAGVDEDLLYLVRQPYGWRREPDTIHDLRIVVGNRFPSVSTDQLRRAAAFGLALTIDHRGVFDLRTLEPVIREFQGLHLYLGEYTGWDTLERLTGLRTLSLVDTEPDAPIDLAHLPRLEEAGVKGKNVLTVASNPSLRRLFLNAPSLRSGFRVVAPLTELTLFTRRGPSDLDFLERAEDLRELTLERCESFDAASLRRSPLLESLKLTSREVRNIDAFRDLSALRLLHLEGCRTAPGAEVLAELPLEQVRVYPNHLFDEDFQQRVQRLPGHWDITELVRPSRRVTSATRAEFQDSQDAETFAPFGLTEPYDDGDAYQLSFTDWNAVAERFESDTLAGLYLNGPGIEGIVRETIRQDAPELLPHLEFDSEGDGFHAFVDSLERLEQAARIAWQAWSSKARMRTLARIAAQYQDGEPPE